MRFGIVGPARGDRIVIVGAGIVGLLVAFLAARLPGAEVRVVDVLAERAPLVEAVGASFATPDALMREDRGHRNGARKDGDGDVVFHTSATSGGLDCAIAAAGFEATIVEMSWYGDSPVTVGLGGAFHAKRLRIISSQVGHVAPARRARWSHRRRLETAIRLLDCSTLDILVRDQVPFDETTKRLEQIFSDSAALPPVIAY